MNAANTLLALSACLITSSLATQQDLMFNEGRSLAGNTIKFAPNYNHEGEQANRGAVVGMVLGFFGFVFVVVFAIGSLIHDDVQRHRKLEGAIKTSVETLKSKY